MSKIAEQIKNLPSPLDTYASLDPTKIGRYAVMSFTGEFVAAGHVSLGQILEHPDMPKDAEPLFQLAVTDPRIRIMLASSEWDLVPEGMMPPTIDLVWQRTETEPCRPLATGAKPLYATEMKCPHCKHKWESI